jgi:hypothetical protein
MQIAFNETKITKLMMIKKLGYWLDSEEEKLNDDMDIDTIADLGIEIEH